MYSVQLQCKAYSVQCITYWILHVMNFVLILCYELTILIGRAQLKDPPRSFTRITSYNCLAYPHAFRCVADGVCIPPERVRDGVNDCLDGSDEAPDVNICDYAPYFSDYRCSLYADCIDLPDGYACRCKRGMASGDAFFLPLAPGIRGIDRNQWHTVPWDGDNWGYFVTWSLLARLSYFCIQRLLLYQTVPKPPSWK